jgi:hypothetical protein
MRKKFKRPATLIDPVHLAAAEDAVLRHISHWGTSVEEIWFDVFLPHEVIRYILMRLRRKGLIKTHRTIVARRCTSPTST